MFANYVPPSGDIYFLHFVVPCGVMTFFVAYATLSNLFVHDWLRYYSVVTP